MNHRRVCTVRLRTSFFKNFLLWPFVQILCLFVLKKPDSSMEARIERARATERVDYVDPKRLCIQLCALRSFTNVPLKKFSSSLCGKKSTSLSRF